MFEITHEEFTGIGSSDPADLLPLLRSENPQGIRRIARLRLTVLLKSFGESEKLRWADILFSRLRNSADSWEQRNIIEVLSTFAEVEVDNKLMQIIDLPHIDPHARERALCLLRPSYAKFSLK